MKLESVAFLRQIGMPELYIPDLAAGRHVTITGDVLLSYLRASYREGRKDARDPYVWHDVSALLDGEVTG